MRDHDSGFGRRLFAPALALALCFGLGCTAAEAQTASPLELNEHFVEKVTQSHDVDMDDVKSVFGFVFRNLPDRAKVYPTEHYYYFRFSHRGVTYGGNLRLENELRDQGKLHFAYTAEFSEWLPPGDTKHQLFERKDGIELDRIDDFTYRVTYEGKSVVFELNRMEGVKPPAGTIAEGERYIGPIYDEAAVRFFLVYNSTLKQFLYLLDETGPQSDGLVSSQVSDRILIGQRTGFAYYRDHKLDRRILIGVFGANSRVNNYYDGPFDQLPDNFLEGDALRDAILEIEPALKGQIDRYGSSFDGETRYMIAPYLHYDHESELEMFHRCATNKRIPERLYYACFAIDEQGGGVAAERAQPKEPEKRQRPGPRKQRN
jgi:hypothetical protein